MYLFSVWLSADVKLYENQDHVHSLNHCTPVSNSVTGTRETFNKYLYEWMTNHSFIPETINYHLGPF